MTGSRRTLHVSLLLISGASFVAVGTVLLALTGVLILNFCITMVLSGVTAFGASEPEYDVVSPSLAVLGGAPLFLVGWVFLIRCATAAWPDRFDRSRRMRGPGTPAPEDDDDDTDAITDLLRP